MFTKILKSSHLSFVRGFATQAVRLQGSSQRVKDSRHVQLRGTYLKGNFNDLPNMIFFPELCDQASNWTGFFTNPDNKILDYRNVYLIDPRNFGNSDFHSSFDLTDMAEDVVRFMYQHKISTATLAGHGFGAKLATAVGCYFPERVTGVVGIDGGPLDHRYHESFQEIRDNLQKLTQIDLRGSRGDLDHALKRDIADPKWRAIFAQGLKKVSDRQFDWGFNLEDLSRNINFNKADSVGNWTEKHGIYGGRAMFIFPEYSRWIHLNTNTLPLHKICVHLKGFGSDIFAIQGDENPLNHWMYESEHYTFPLSRKLTKFLRLYDGVHVLLKDRTEIGNYFIPDLPYSRKDSDHIHRDYSPAHLHHNWRFSTIYEDADRITREAVSAAQQNTAELSKEDAAKKN